MSDKPRVPGYYFSRQDEAPDEHFYAFPRMEKHIDDATIDAITDYYRQHLAPQANILDLMSSWISHLPPELKYPQVTGLGMNAEELGANPALSEYVVQNLNDNPVTSFKDNSFDAVLIVVSIQYLTRPFEVFKDIARILSPGGQCIVSMSHRLFPTKAIYAFQTLSPADRCRLVMTYMHETGDFKHIETVDQSPANADPLWIVHGRKTA